MLFATKPAGTPEAKGVPPPITRTLSALAVTLVIGIETAVAAAVAAPVREPTKLVAVTTPVTSIP